MTVPSPTDPAYAAAAVEEFLDDARWKQQIAEHGWVISVVDPRTLSVELRARAVDGEEETYLLLLTANYYPTWPPDAHFVNPGTLAYDPTHDVPYLPKLTAPYCYVHPTYSYQPPYPYGPQLVCSSMTLGYYFGHNPQEHERWDPDHYTIGTTIYVVHRALQSEHYQGRMA